MPTQWWEAPSKSASIKASVPEPLTATVVGLDAPLWVSVITPESEITSVGVYVTVTTSVAPGATEPLNVPIVNFALSDEKEPVRSPPPKFYIVRSSDAVDEVFIVPKFNWMERQKPQVQY